MWEGDSLHPSISYFLISFEMCMGIPLNRLISFSFTYRWLMSILVEIGSLFTYISLQKYMYWMMKGQTDGQEGSQTKIHENNPNTHSYSSLLLTSLSILTAARLGYWALVRADRGWLTSSELPISVTTTDKLLAIQHSYM